MKKSLDTIISQLTPCPSGFIGTTSEITDYAIEQFHITGSYAYCISEGLDVVQIADVYMGWVENSGYNIAGNMHVLLERSLKPRGPKRSKEVNREAQLKNLHTRFAKAPVVDARGVADVYLAETEEVKDSKGNLIQIWRVKNEKPSDRISEMVASTLRILRIEKKDKDADGNI